MVSDLDQPPNIAYTQIYMNLFVFLNLSQLALAFTLNSTLDCTRDFEVDFALESGSSLNQAYIHLHSLIQ